MGRTGLKHVLLGSVGRERGSASALSGAESCGRVDIELANDIMNGN